jgi:hypothetical protein
MTATELAATLYTQDAAHTSPWLVDGLEAYAGWRRAAAEHGDAELGDLLMAVRPRDFAEAWDALAEAR